MFRWFQEDVDKKGETFLEMDVLWIFCGCAPIRRLLKGQRTVVSVLFPFAAFFADAPQPLFPAESYESDMEIAEGCFRHGDAMTPVDKHC